MIQPLISMDGLIGRTGAAQLAMAGEEPFWRAHRRLIDQRERGRDGQRIVCAAWLHQQCKSPVGISLAEPSIRV